ncbi:uncharacterized protein LOC124309911 [Neodiprion virginianus]|uniref:uncharacterized protein LOC124309911 n=1 Tax=Neodiprion virginianus TaxID=2961670 RepID=UPI001EE6D61E|nr:uncharacterized protein LOC124309911 [Neodiprion virginianus]
MEKVKVKFQFAAEAWDAKTTVIKVKSIQVLEQEQIFSFEQKDQPISNHAELAKLPVVKGIIKSLDKRGKQRKAIVSLDAHLQRLYFDEEGNVVFNDHYLEEIETPQPTPNSSSLTVPARETPIQSISKGILLEKFSNRNQNAKSWLTLFVLECERFKVEENQFPEVLKLVLEGPAIDWFTSIFKTYGMTKPWSFWESSFLETFGEKSWSEVEYAYSFRWISGPYLDFALKKRNLLIDADPELGVSSQINFIVIALPKFVRSHLHKRELKTIENLMSSLSQLQPISNNNSSRIEINKQNRKFDPCRICEKAGYKNRFHPEEICRNARSAIIKSAESKN